MGKKDPRIDAYIAKSADFAKPILTHLRKLVHQGCPEVVETIKWSAPHFDYKGILCSMAAFKAHCAFGFWRGQLIFGDNGGKAEEAMGHFGRIASTGDLPDDKTILGYIRKAVALADEGGNGLAKKTVRTPKPPVKVPPKLAAALKKNKQARATFEAFSPSHRREYVEWITEAKTGETRNRRLETAMLWLAQGKSRNWKYQNC